MVQSGHASGDAVMGVTIATTIISLIAVISRLATRLGIVRNAGVDDIFIGIAWLFSVATTVTMVLQVKHGMGRHQYDLSEHDQLAQLKPFWVSVIVYNLSISSAKFSILFQYLRIFPQQRFRQACYTLMAVVGIYSCWTFFSAVFACSPISFFWNPMQEGHCLNRFAVWFANAGMNIVTDVATALLPLPVLKSLELPPRQKHVLLVIFALGGFTCIVSILRLYSLYVISATTDISWNNPLAAIWSSVEINTGILCSCLPTLKGCVTRFFPNLFGSARSRTRSLAPSHLGTYGRSKMSHDAFGRGLSGRETPVHKTVIQSTYDGTSSDEHIDMTGMPSGKDRRQIQVTTVVEQDFGGRAESVDTESMKGLVR